MAVSGLADKSGAPCCVIAVTLT
ncbi:hypothetical protein BOSE127_100348 [Bosea sp. 127]|nr:hypothetical protein BOSE7B_50677 [Bosea sp. 7B]VXB14019.1 hypothetical protein BOSE127_100348 [Bosea sp. 127]